MGLFGGRRRWVDFDRLDFDRLDFGWVIFEWVVFGGQYRHICPCHIIYACLL